MVFSSYLFLFYLLPLALFAYYIAPMRARNLVLTLFSYVFYGWANPLFLFLLLGSTLLDYTSGLLIAKSEGVFVGNEYVVDPNAPRSRRAKIILAISVVTNLSLLGFFKYFNFGVENYDALIEWIGLPELRLDTALRVTLPLGISFYTFESMSYVIDV
jgi:alginate O-acetyltransferase complex protein AlgI